MTTIQEANGAQLYKIVAEYADLGIHRTGTEVDRATVEWFADKLADRGAIISRHQFGFDYFDAAAKVTINGQKIESLPLYYEAVGETKTDHVAVAEFGDGEHGSGLDRKLEEVINAAVAGGYDALVIATHGADGRLIAINCEPTLRNRIPVILVPGRYADTLKASTLSVEYAATVTPASSTNIIGQWNRNKSATEQPFIITTPMSGWFTCAGERGTGIAVAIHVAEALAKRAPNVPLKFIALSGHELGFCGAYRLAETVSAAPRGVLHVGSCIAAVDAQHMGIVHADKATCDSIGAALGPIGVNPKPPKDHRNPAYWVGESQCWAKFGMPMLSVAGLSPLFHTADDITVDATTPDLLAAAANCLADAALALINTR